MPAYLFDTLVTNAYGGSGKVFDWQKLAAQRKFRRPFIVSGGLTPQNVGRAVSVCRPFAVDVSSGVEKSPGKKDHTLIQAFFHALRQGGHVA